MEWFLGYKNTVGLCLKVIILGKFFFLFSDYQITNEKKLLALIISKNLLFIKAEYFSITTEVILCMLYSVFSRKKTSFVQTNESGCSCDCFSIPH